MLRRTAFFLLLIVMGTTLVALAGDPPMTDGQINDTVRLKLAGDPDVKGGALEVDVQSGVVTLKGTVVTEKVKAKAERLTRKVKGVKDVKNNLVVKPKGF